MGKYYYGIIFWNEKTDNNEGIYTYFLADSFFDAEKKSEHNNKTGYIKGIINFLGYNKPKEYNINFFDFTSWQYNRT